jgi:hypothetical protein
MLVGNQNRAQSTHMSNATLHFHSAAAKSAFIARNKVATAEIIRETSASITILTDEDFSNSVFVFQITKP